MPRRLARQILEEGRSGKHSPRQIRRAMSRLCRTSYVQKVPRGWALSNWLRAHGVVPENICVWRDQPDGSILVRWFGALDPAAPVGPSLDEHAPGPRSRSARRCSFEAGCACA